MTQEHNKAIQRLVWAQNNLEDAETCILDDVQTAFPLGMRVIFPDHGLTRRIGTAHSHGPGGHIFIGPDDDIGEQECHWPVVIPLSR